MLPVLWLFLTRGLPFPPGPAWIMILLFPSVAGVTDMPPQPDLSVGTFCPGWPGMASLPISASLELGWQVHASSCWLRWSLANFLHGLSLNCHHSNLHFLSKDYRPMPVPGWS
jgi:hypothetical protein